MTEELKQARLSLWSEIYKIVKASESEDKEEMLEYLEQMLKSIEVSFN